MCDKKNKVLFTDTECLVLSPDFKLPDENQVLLRVPRQNNMYSFNLENIVPSGGLACLIAKATVDESNKWHRRLGHVNFKNLNKLVKGNLATLVKGRQDDLLYSLYGMLCEQKNLDNVPRCLLKERKTIKTQSDRIYCHRGVVACGNPVTSAADESIRERGGFFMCDRCDSG
ncbi:ribonuclease H-like domain-containing protein [Tanacetum coccineum]|uniref:Ribonuclease H-like domain-containing protein n=1 Tax=Tanacetum coccineum TaxID=301880 RepID=A0ABQ5GMY8_9ASTR